VDVPVELVGVMSVSGDTTGRAIPVDCALEIAAGTRLSKACRVALSL
jgi:hypothetical protein